MHKDITTTRNQGRSSNLLSAGLVFASLLCMVETVNAQGAVLEVVHPEVERGEVEIEVLNGFGLGSVANGEERPVHEFAVGIGVTDHWKITGAVEVANPQGDNVKVEAFELENLIVLPIGGIAHAEEEEDGDRHSGLSLGLFTALEIPTEGGISEGALEVGPVIGIDIGPAELVGNLFVEVPFADGEDPGLSYASQLVIPVNESFGVGIENFGEFEGLFGARGLDKHFAGPALYWEAELPNGHVFEPRLAVLFGLNDNSADAVLSFNIEYKFGGK